MAIKVCIAGASGYTGLELLRILSIYRDIKIVQITSRQYAGKALKEVFPFFIKSPFSDLIFDYDINENIADFYFLALPHEASLEKVKILLSNNKKVIDLSGAYRIKNPTKYPEYYGFEHKYVSLLETAVYGLPEIFRDKIKKANLVANPGCYPTATLLGIYPVLKEDFLVDNTIIVNALSGISGAGRNPKQQFHYPEAFGDVYAYNPLKHRHTPEMEDIIYRVYQKQINIKFVPHIVPISRGMLSNISFRTNLSNKDFTELYRLEYRYEPFIRVLDEPPHVKNVIGTNYCDIYVNVDERTGYATVISVIDNLGKGASSQAVQNFNIMAGFEEDKYLKELSFSSLLFP